MLDTIIQTARAYQHVIIIIIYLSNSICFKYRSVPLRLYKLIFIVLFIESRSEWYNAILRLSYAFIISLKCKQPTAEIVKVVKPPQTIVVARNR